YHLQAIRRAQGLRQRMTAPQRAGIDRIELIAAQLLQQRLRLRLEARRDLDIALTVTDVRRDVQRGMAHQRDSHDLQARTSGRCWPAARDRTRPPSTAAWRRDNHRYNRRCATGSWH